MTTQENKTIDEAQIRILRENLAISLRAKNVDGVMSHYAAIDLTP